MNEPHQSVLDAITEAFEAHPNDAPGEILQRAVDRQRRHNADLSDLSVRELTDSFKKEASVGDSDGE